MKTVNENALGPSTLMLDYDTRGWPRGQAFEFDREALRATYELRRPAGTDAHWFKSEIRLVGSLMLARNDGGGGHILVRDGRHVESNPGTYLKLQVFSRPGGSLASGDQIMKFDPGSVFVIDQSRPYRQTMPPGKNFTFFLPHARVNYRPAAMPAVLRFDCGTPEGRFLSHTMRIIFRLAGVATTADNSGLAHALCGSVAGLLESHASRTGRSAVPQTARIDAARRVIDLNLADPGFGVEDVLAQVGASRATLYRDFAPMGGLMAYVKSRRLEVAYHILAMSPRRRGAVGNAATGAGFASLASFSREFRELYGSSPSDILGQWRNDSDDSHRPFGSSPFAQPDALRAIYTWPTATTAIGYLAHCSDAQL
jgi:AraC-like DNA-binding protein